MSTKNATVITMSPEAFAASQAELNRLRAQAKLPPSALQLELDALRAEHQQLLAQQAQDRTKPTITMSAKGCVTVNTRQGWPVALYPSQWEQLFSIQEDLEALIAARKAA